MLWGAASANSFPLYRKGIPSMAKLRASMESTASGPGKASILTLPSCAMSWLSRKRRNTEPLGNSRMARTSASTSFSAGAPFS